MSWSCNNAGYNTCMRGVEKGVPVSVSAMYGPVLQLAVLHLCEPGFSDEGGQGGH